MSTSFTSNDLYLLFVLEELFQVMKIFPPHSRAISRHDVLDIIAVTEDEPKLQRRRSCRSSSVNSTNSAVTENQYHANHLSLKVNMASHRLDAIPFLCSDRCTHSMCLCLQPCIYFISLIDFKL